MTQRSNTASPSNSEGLAVVIVAAGSGTRLGHGIPKALVPLRGRPLLERALEGVRARWPHAHVVVTVPAHDTELSALSRAAGAVPVTGAGTRAQSVARALAAVPEGVRWIAVHDAARCLVPGDVFDRVLTAAVVHGARAVVPVVDVDDTIRRVDAHGHALGVVPRSQLRAVQTPQLFDADLLLEVYSASGLLSHREAHDEAHDEPHGAPHSERHREPRPSRARDGAHAASSEPGETHPAIHAAPQDPVGITDDASLVERFAPHVAVRLVAGDERSLKITRPLDLALAEAVVDRAEDGRG